MIIRELKDADLSLVELIKGKPYCKLHGSMNKLTKHGIWRCVTTYSVTGYGTNNERFKENACRAGCQERSVE